MRVLRSVLVVSVVGLVGVGGGELFVVGATASADAAEVQPVRKPAGSGYVERVTDTTFDASVLRAKGPCAVLFYSPRDQGSRRFKPVFEDFAALYGDELKFAEFDVDQNSGTAKRYGVSRVPTTVVFEDGEPVGTIYGVLSADDLAARLAEVL